MAVPMEKVLGEFGPSPAIFLRKELELSRKYRVRFGRAGILFPSFTDRSLANFGERGINLVLFLPETSGGGEVGKVRLAPRTSDGDRPLLDELRREIHA